ncbi:hypothetical protein BZG36_03912 [Bifiguratus adelaidae]|uniref:26S proteasome non-ATPase regulatory subunit 5 n=1 Tax=Bifiguratus adelaidae TaxID=1938954 RepID=A0A261XXN8_9FUNG|nr:hypothetical protein BZG36_03912 [Bifiguratus adelaidae]
MSPAPTPEAQRLARLLSDAGSAHGDIVRAAQDLMHSLGDPAEPAKVRSALSTVPIKSLFDLLGSSEPSTVEVTCDLIDKLLSPFDYTALVAQDMLGFLIEGYNHFSPFVRRLAIKQTDKFATDDSGIDILTSQNIYPLIVVTMSFQDTQTAEMAIDLIVKMYALPSGKRAFHDPNTVVMLKQLISTSDTVKFRGYELIAKLAGESAQSFDAIERLGLFNDLVNDCKSTDVLIRMNAFEVVAEVRSPQSPSNSSPNAFPQSIKGPKGFAFAQKSGILKEIINVLAAPNVQEDDLKDVTKVLLICSALKFIATFGSLDSERIQLLDDKYKIYSICHQYLHVEQTSVQSAAIYSMTHLITNPNILRLCLASQPNQHLDLTRATHTLPRLWREGLSGEPRITWLRGMSQAFECTEDNRDLADITFQLYEEMDGVPTTLQQLANLAKQPVDDQQVSVFAFLTAIASWRWGALEMLSSPAFMDYLFDRSTESSHSGKVWKYTLVQTILNTVELIDTNAPLDVVDKLTKYVKDGPFYVSRRPNVDLESG